MLSTETHVMKYDAQMLGSAKRHLRYADSSSNGRAVGCRGDGIQPSIQAKTNMSDDNSR